MPLYEYRCAGCGHRFEKIEKVTARNTHKCPECGARAKRLLASPAIQFKGSGWYVTDYARKAHAGESAKSEKVNAKEVAETKETAKQPKKGSPAHKEK